VRLHERLGARDGRLESAAVGRREPAREQAGVDAEPSGEPLDRVRRRARLAPLDLADVLLREPAARERGLAQTCREPQLAQPCTQRAGRLGRGRRRSRGSCNRFFSDVQQASFEPGCFL